MEFPDYFCLFDHKTAPPRSGANSTPQCVSDARQDQFAGKECVGSKMIKWEWELVGHRNDTKKNDLQKMKDWKHTCWL